VELAYDRGKIEEISFLARFFIYHSLVSVVLVLLTTMSRVSLASKDDSSRVFQIEARHQ
jgi:hypothetical protein